MHDDLTAALRANGLQVTAQRVAVLRAVTTHPHSTAAQVADAVRDQIGTISQQSVYDTLAVLADQAILRRIQPSGSSARYEARVGDNHHHLVCRTCDQIVDVDCATGQTPCLTPSLTPTHGKDFAVDEAEVVYWGLCHDCQMASATRSAIG